MNHLKQRSTTDSKRFLKLFRIRTPDKLVFEQLNINSLRNKVEKLSNQIKGTCGLWLYRSTDGFRSKLDDNLSSRNFTSHRLDRNSNADKLMLFVRKDIPLKPVEVIKHPLCYKNQSHRTRIE